MIHAFEAELRWIEGKFGRIREILLILLYKDFVKRLGQKKVDSLLQTTSESIFWEWGHSLLFSLKSLDIDIRLKLPFGSVFAYGKKDWF